MDIKGSRINKFQAVFFGIALSYKIRANQSRPENNDDVDDVSLGIIRACIWGPYGALPLAPLSVLAGHCVRLSYCLQDQSSLSSSLSSPSRVAELGSLGSGAKIKMKIFV